jgi:hypothetical protein
MNGTSSTVERRNQRISVWLRRIQGQIVALERSLAKEPEFTVLLQRAAAARGAMSEGLGKGHVAPPPLTLRMEAHDALLHVFCQSGVKEIFHCSCSPSRVDCP